MCVSFGLSMEILTKMSHVPNILKGTRGIVERIEYDPNRTALIALLRHAEAAEGYEGQKHAPLSYIVCPRGVAVGHELQASRSGAVDVKPGNSMQLRHIPVLSLIHI